MANDYERNRQRGRSAGPRGERYEGENRADRQNRVRNYDREDMRDYARRSVNQGNRLRGMRGGRGDYETEIGRVSNRGYGYRMGTDQDFTRREGRQPSSFPSDNIDLERGPNRMDFDYDIYTVDAGYGRGYDRDRSTSADYVDNYWGERQQNRVYGDRDNRDWDWIYSRSPQDTNWWNTTGGRADYTSGRSTAYDRSTEFEQDRWDADSREYDIDPGYAYEFGTDYDFMADMNLNDFGRQGFRQERDRDEGSRGYRGSGSRWGINENRQPRRPQGRSFMESDWDSSASEAEGFAYSWQGQPEDMTSRYVEFWNVPGPFRGIGPSNYQRSDERIQDELCEIFTWNGQIDSSGIEIDVQNGNVTLSGDVDRRGEKYLAEDIASSVIGVRDVDNRIRVTAREDAWGHGMRRDVVMPGRFQEGMRVAGVDGKHIGRVKEIRKEGFILDRQQGGDTFIPFRAVKRTNGQIILHVHANEIDQQGWKERS